MAEQYIERTHQEKESVTIKGVKTFGITRYNFNSFDELINTSADRYNVEFEVFISNSHGTQHGYMKVLGGKVIKTIPLLELNMIASHPVFKNEAVIGYLTESSKNTITNTTKQFISKEDISKMRLRQRFNIPSLGSKTKDILCEHLLQSLILDKADFHNAIEVGASQGWNIRSSSNIEWESRSKYHAALSGIIPDSILYRETAICRTGVYKTPEDYKRKFEAFFNTWPEFKFPLLLRVSSLMLTFASKYNICFNQIMCFITNNMVDSAIYSALFDNIKYGRGEQLVLSDAKEIVYASSLINDGILFVTDDTKADECKKRDDGLSVLQRICLNKKAGQIPILVSNYSASQLRPDLMCVCSIFNRTYDISPSCLREVLEWFEERLITNISKNYIDFITSFNNNAKEVSTKTPARIPVQRLNIYYMLISVLRTYDEVFEVLFDDKTENIVLSILENYNQRPDDLFEKLVTDFSNVINEEIRTGCFHYIQRTKYIIFDKNTNTVLVDDDYIYLETSVVKELIRKKLDYVRDPNCVTTALFFFNNLKVNDHNSKCYRFHVQNSNGESYILYTYGISKKLINAENRKRLELADCQKYLLDYIELSENIILPLGITADGRYVGKDISFSYKSNDHVIITGQSGKGKSFYATNLLPSLAMLGSRMLVFDVSDSFTREEVLRSLPTEVTDVMFDFIEVATVKRKLPINPLFIGDCPGLPAKKRRIVGFIKAIAGKLDKVETRYLTGFISDMLKRYPKVTSVTTDMVRNVLKRSGKVGNHVYSLISSTLDDIDKINFEEQGWTEFFEKAKRIPVISFGNETGDNVHSLLDAIISSLFEWQRDHDTAPLSIVVDEIKDQNFAEGSPLHTILTQGRKFHTKFIGMTQQYISTSSHAIDVVKEAGIKVFFVPAKSLDRIATELGYKNAADAGFGSMGIGDIILCAELYNKEDGVNEPVVLHAKAIKFINTPLYTKFKKEYDIK